MSQFRVDEVQRGICSIIMHRVKVWSWFVLPRRRHTPNEAGGLMNTKQRRGGTAATLTMCARGEHQPFGLGVDLKEWQRVLKGTHQPHMSVGTYFWGRVPKEVIGKR